MTTWGYARVSTAEQETEPQVMALVAAGVPAEQISSEVISGSVPALARPVLASVLGRLEAGDVLVVAKLDRLGRNSADLLGVIEGLDRRGVAVRLLDMGADTGTAAGRLVVQVLAAVAEWERGVMLERTRAGIAAARKAGRHPGRRRVLTPFQRDEAVRMSAEGRSLRDIGRVLGVGKSIVWRAVKEAA
jgi:putative DNA-invertase from lambdoid prophage Rac